jgi:hypothetical protein
MRNGRGRALAAALLVGAILAMGVHYGAVAERHDPHPSAAEIAADYDAHVGERLSLWTTVTGVDGRTLTVRSDPGETLVLQIAPGPPGVQPGDVAQVYGTIEPEYRVAAERVVVSARADRRWMFALSGLAAVLTAGYLLREWTVEWETLTLRPREGRDA